MLLLVLVMFIFVSISQAIGWESSVFCTSQEIGWEDCFWNDCWVCRVVQ